MFVRHSVIGEIDLANRFSLIIEFLRVRKSLSRLRFTVIARSKLAMCSAFRLRIRLRGTRFRIPSQLIVRRPIGLTRFWRRFIVNDVIPNCRCLVSNPIESSTRSALAGGPGRAGLRCYVQCCGTNQNDPSFHSIIHAGNLPAGICLIQRIVIDVGVEVEIILIR